MTESREPISRRVAMTMLAAFTGLGPSAWAQPGAPAEVAAELPGARLMGSGRLTWFGLHVYDARLWVTDGFSAERFATLPLALELQYARSLLGKLIAERSLDEMKRAGGFADEQAQRWLAAMTQAFPDVAKGDRLTGVHSPGEAARFFHNAQPKGEVRDADFARRFFGIWLSAQTSEPKLRASLLSLNRVAS